MEAKAYLRICLYTKFIGQCCVKQMGGSWLSAGSVRPLLNTLHQNEFLAN